MVTPYWSAFCSGLPSAPSTVGAERGSTVDLSYEIRGPHHWSAHQPSLAARLAADCRADVYKQEAQLPQRNSASVAHVEGARPSSPLPLRPSGYTYAYGRIRKPQRTYVKRASTKRTLRWIAHSRSFKVILIGAGRNPERSVVVMCN